MPQQSASFTLASEPCRKEGEGRPNTCPSEELQGAGWEEEGGRVGGGG